jgi:hypothetical protein
MDICDLQILSWSTWWSRENKLFCVLAKVAWTKRSCYGLGRKERASAMEGMKMAEDSASFAGHGMQVEIDTAILQSYTFITYACSLFLRL